jgi:N-acetyl-alpha-D-glucosaminyl L-malate synthase BshA
MRIGIVCHRGIGGSARVAVSLARELSVRGHDVYVFARTAPFGLTDGDQGLRLHVLAAGAPRCSALDVNWTVADLEALTELIAGVELDVLHYHYAVPFAAVAAAIRSRFGRAAPLIVGTLHGTDVSLFGRSRATNAALRRAFAAADALTAVSRHQASLAGLLFELDRPLTVIPNFIDLERFAPRGRRPGPTPRIVHVSNLREVKRPAAMARIFASVSSRTGAELWLVGDGEGVAAVEAILAGAGVSNRMLGFGPRLDLDAILPDADVLLVTSETESFCLAALEAAACAVPAVAPRVGGLPEVVRDGVTGLLYPAGDDRAAEHALMSLIVDRPLQSRLGAAARERATKFAVDKVVPRYEALYAALLGDAFLPRRSVAVS